MNKKVLLVPAIILFQLLAFALVSVALERPAGSIAGQISLEKKGFHLQFSKLNDQKVYVTASGPRGKPEEERGVWVKSDGKFQIDHLEKGEYALKVHASGYGTEYRNGVFVNDGKVTELDNLISLDILHPSISLGSNRKVFTSQETPYFWINCSGTNKATIKLYKTDIVKFMHSFVKNKKGHGDDSQNDDGSINFGNNLSLYKGYGSKEPKLFANQNPVEVLNRKVESNEDDWANLQFKLKKPLAYGDYIGLAEASNAAGEKEWDIFWFNVSDLGLVVKHDSREFFAQAIDLNTLKPIENAQLQIIGGNGTNYLNQLKTGADGLVKTQLSDALSAENNLITIGTNGQSHTYGGLWFSDTSNESNHYRTYFYTERPIYRLGQTVYFKGITRTLDGDGFHTPDAGLTVSTIIEDPNNNKIWQGNFRTNSYGSFNGTFSVPQEGSTGAYQLTFTFPDGSKQYGAFEVAQYRKPEYEVTVTPSQPRVIGGNKITAKVKAKYYFGSPVANAHIKYSIYSSPDWSTHYRLMPRPTYYGYFDDWSSNDEDDGAYSNYSGGGDFITEGTAQTDANGEATIEVETKKSTPPSSGPYDSDYGDKVYKIEAEVTDLSRMSVVSSGSCCVSAGDFSLFVQPASYVVNVGNSISASIDAINYDNKPVANQSLTIKLARWVWDQKDNQYKGLELESEQSVSTDAQGKSAVVFQVKNSLPSDSYYIIAQAKDSFGNQIYDQSGVWIASKDYPYVRNGDEAKKETLQVKLDKFAYQPGDIAKAVITAPITGKEGAKALIAIEGTKIHKCWTAALTATANVIEIPILSSYAPNVYVTVSVVGLDHQFYNQSKIVRVSPKEHFLNLVISTDKDQYKPGEVVKYSVKATNKDGQPVANAELSLGLVDESIYAIRAETAENIQKFFYDKRANWVLTNCTFSEEYSGGPDKLDSGGKIRKEFKDTAAWIPELKTDKNGIATANITLPDNLTTWRATVRGTTQGTDIGATINKIISTQDLIVRLSLPRFFSLGDEAFISVVVHNYTKVKQPIRLLLSTSPQFSISEKLEQHINVLPDKAQRFSWPVKVTGSGQANVTIRAIGKTAADAMESKVNILPLGLPAFIVKCGELLEDPSSVNIPVPKKSDICPGTFKQQLSIAASSIGPVLGNFDKLINYPYGCTEQTMSRLIPSIVAMKLHKELGLPIDNAQSVRFAEVYKRSMAKLKDYQHGDGGWGWWQTDQSNLYLTSLVLEGFYQLKQVGYPVDAGQIKQGTAWLSKSCKELCTQLTDKNLVYYSQEYKVWQERELGMNLAKALYTMSLYNIKPPAKAVRYLIGQIGSLPPETLCYLSMTLKQTNDNRFNQCYKQLLELANRKGDFVEWDHTKEMLERLGIVARYRYSDYTYCYTGIETTALALKTVLTIEPENTKLIESIKRWLLLERDNNGWANTKTTAQVFLALMQEQLLFDKQISTNETLTISLANKLLKQLSFNIDNRLSAEEQIDLPQDAQKISLNKTGSGRIYYNNLSTYTRLLKPGENIAASGSPEGLSLERSFYRLSPSTTTSDGKIHFTSEKITDHIVKAGETVLMKVKVDAPVRLPYVILEAYLPSGAEISEDKSKEDSIKTNNSKGDESDLEGDWGNSWWTHQDILDDRIVFFCTDLPQGKSEFSTLVRMEMPGKYQINPLKLEGMYAKNVRAYSSLDTLEVKE